MKFISEEADIYILEFIVAAAVSYILVLLWRLTKINGKAVRANITRGESKETVQNHQNTVEVEKEKEAIEPEKPKVITENKITDEFVINQFHSPTLINRPFKLVLPDDSFETVSTYSTGTGQSEQIQKNIYFCNTSGDNSLATGSCTIKSAITSNMDELSGPVNLHSTPKFDSYSPAHEIVDAKVC